MKYEESGKKFSEAGQRMRDGDVLKAFDMYCDALLERLSVSSDNTDFFFFFRSQLIKYLREKNSLFLGLAEADMVSDLIRCTYDEFNLSLKNNPFIRSEKGRFRLLMAVKIIFPVQNDTGLSELVNIVSK